MFVRTHVAAYFVCLLVSDLFQAVGSILNITWIHESGVYAGDVCTAQGILKQISDVSIAFWTLVIAIHTFCLLGLELQLRQFVLWATLIAGWFSIGTIVVAGPAALAIGDVPFYGITGYWCWISPEYETERVTLDYMFMFISAICSFILYTMIFLKLRGNLRFNGGVPTFRWTPITRVGSWGATEKENRAFTIAKHMVLYPIAYTVVFLPIAVTRLSAFAGHVASLEITIFSATLYLLSGTVNVILFASARNILLPESTIVKKWSISLPRLLQSTSRDTTGIDPYYVESQSTYHRTPPDDKFPETGSNLDVPTLPRHSVSMAQISPLWIPEQHASYIVPQATSTRRETDIQVPARSTLQSSYDYEDVLHTYEDVDLDSADSMVLAPTSDPSSGSEYSMSTR